MPDIDFEDGADGGFVFAGLGGEGGEVVGSGDDVHSRADGLEIPHGGIVPTVIGEEGEFFAAVDHVGIGFAEGVEARMEVVMNPGEGADDDVIGEKVVHGLFDIGVGDGGEGGKVGVGGKVHGVDAAVGAAAAVKPDVLSGEEGG